jgi:hypothetical protein
VTLSHCHIIKQKRQKISLEKRMGDGGRGMEQGLVIDRSGRDAGTEDGGRRAEDGAGTGHRQVRERCGEMKSF